MGVATLIRDGRKCIICEDCTNVQPLDTPETKCSKCGAWYEVIIEKTVSGIAG